MKKIRVYHFYVAYNADDDALENILQNRLDALREHYYDVELVSVVVRSSDEYETRYSSVYTYISLKD